MAQLLQPYWELLEPIRQWLWLRCFPGVLQGFRNRIQQPDQLHLENDEISTDEADRMPEDHMKIEGFRDLARTTLLWTALRSPPLSEETRSVSNNLIRGYSQYEIVDGFLVL